MTDPTPPDPDIEQVTQEIARHLNETLAGPIRQIGMVVKHMGADFARDTLRETLAVEASGGMLTADGSRRRTPGGVFFYLAKAKMPPEARAVIFPLPHQARKIPTIAWEERLPLFESVLEATANGKHGLLTALPRTTLMGRPGPVFKSDHTVAFELQYALPEELTYSRGIPKPPLPYTLRYLVIAGREQYERIEKALRKNAKERLIVEGICIHDTEINMMVVLAVIVTTRGNQKRAREDMRQPMLTVEDNGAMLTLPGHPVPHPTFERAKKQQREVYRQIKEKPDKGDPPRTARKTAHAEAAAAKPAHSPKPPTPPQQPTPIGLTPPITLRPATEAMWAKLRDLEQTANTLRERMATMEAKKQPGVAMTKKLLENTERQIEALRRDLQV